MTAVAICGLLFTGCGERIPDADEAVEQGMLLLGNGAEPRTLDPHRATGVTENKVISALLEGLISYHPTDDNIPEPGVAERWESSEDASVWYFYLREDARWSNGDPVTAHDFVYSYERMLTPALAAEYVQMLFMMKNAREFHLGEVTSFEDVGVRAIDDRTIRFELVGPTPFFPNVLKHYSWFPVHPPTIEKHGGMTSLNGEWTRLENFVGNGAFVLDGWRPNQFIRVTRSSTYWDHENVGLNGIVFFPVTDDNTERRMFDSGLIHMTNTVPSNDIPSLRRNRPDVLRMDPYLGTYFYRLNVTRPPLDDVRVRRALALSIDRQRLVDRVTMGDQIPAYGFVPPGFPEYENQTSLRHDPEEARRLLAEAGFPGGAGFPQFFLLFNTSEGHRKLAEAVVDMWNVELGINMHLENKEWKVYLDTQVHMDYDVSRSGWIGDYMDPITFLELFTTDNGNNNTGWSNARYDGLIAAGFRSQTQEEHYAVLQEAEAILMDEVPVIPVYYYTRIYLKDPRVRGWHPKLLDNHSYKYVYLGDPR